MRVDTMAMIAVGVIVLVGLASTLRQRRGRLTDFASGKVSDRWLANARRGEINNHRRK